MLIGIGLIVGATLYKNNLENKYGDWIRVQGRVVDYEEEYKRGSENDYHWYYSEIVEYEVNGKSYRKTSQSSSNIRPTIGKTREVAYNPDNVQESVLLSTDKKPVVIILYSMGGIFTVVGVLGLITKIKEKVKEY